MKCLPVIALLAWSCLSARATITLDITAGLLQTATPGEAMPANGQVLLVASTLNSSFGEPTPGSFVSGDDVILARWNMGSTDGSFLNTLNFNLVDFANLTTGDPLRLYWYPTILDGTATPQYGMPYGSRPDGADFSTGLGGIAWTLPADGNTYSLFFLTQSTGGGSNPDSFGNASFLVPEASNVITAGLALGVCALGLTRAARQMLSKRAGSRL